MKPKMKSVKIQYQNLSALKILSGDFMATKGIGLTVLVNEVR